MSTDREKNESGTATLPPPGAPEPAPSPAETLPEAAAPEPPAEPARASRRREAAPERQGGLSFGVTDVLFFPVRMIMRLFFPKLVDRYVMGELLGPLLFGWTLFIILFVFSLNLFRLAQFAARGAPIEMVGEMLWLRVVTSAVYCIPMSMLLSGLMAFGRLSGDSELIAMQAGGINNLRIVRNAFLLGLVLSFAGLAMNEYVIPPAGQRLHMVETQVKALLKGQIVEDLAGDKAFIIQDIENKKLTRLVAAKKFVPEQDGRPAYMRDVTYIQYDEDGIWNTIVAAERAEYIGESEWKFINAETQFRHTVVSDQRVTWRARGEMTLELNKKPEQVVEEQKDADSMSYRELKAYIEQLKGDKVKPKVLRELRVELERKLAIPFAAMVFALIGAPLGIRRQRSTAGVGIGLSLLIIILYYVGMSFFGVLGENGRMEPLHAAWGCNAIGLLVGLFLTWKASR
ncbi:MAG: LptF/LptG family permease [Armatimonadota bacterium]